jgi:curved DNA-binding protein CbpA
MNPYDVLGVAQNASEEGIRAAYRLAASRAHPDRHGGDHEQMQEINYAYAILSDPVRRKAFDETGDTAVNNDEQVAAQLAAAALIDALDNCADTDNCVAFAKKQLMHRWHQISLDANKWKRALKKLEVAKKRLRFRGEGESFLHSVIDSKHDEISKLIQTRENEAEHLDRGIRFLDAYGWDAAVMVTQPRAPLITDSTMTFSL